MFTDTLDYQDGDTALEAFIAYDDSVTGPRPTVLVSHDWTGRGEFAMAKAKEIAGLGYVAIAIDMYGKGVLGKDDDPELNMSLMNPLVGDRAALRNRVHAALSAARALDVVDSTKVAAMGYCFGGMCVLELARSGADVLGVISIHGIFAPGEVANETITSKVLCLHGQDDPMVPPAQVLDFQNEMTAAKVDWQVHAYGLTSHAFTHPGANQPDFGMQFNPDANSRATQSIENFLGEVFA